MTMRKAIITGANGFIGSKLTEQLLSEGWSVTAIVRERADALDALGANPQLRVIRSEEAGKLSDGEPRDAFFHLAWTGSGGPLRADYNVQLANVKASLDYHALAQRLGCRRFICTGTIGEKMIALPECQGIRSQNFVYVNCKACLHRLLRALEKPDTCKVVWATLGNLYGAGDPGGNIVNYTLRALLDGREAEFGPSDQFYDFVYADDCVQALLRLGAAPALVSDAFYVGSGRPAKLAEFVQTMGRAWGREDLIRIGRRPDDGTRYRKEWFSITALQAETGYAPAFSFDEGLRSTLESMKQARPS